ncbi:MAG: glycosyltransferase family 2 protein, partial [Anaerolineae bacterium]|nr:glycosyltransferase family 2 protein [Anaerolineae bacterium]
VRVEGETQSMTRPFVSVIIPIRNEESFIARSLGAVLAQDYPADRMEILVADGMSDDGTLAIIAALPGAERVRVIPNPGRIQAAGLNAAIQQARGKIIVRVDGHTIIAPDYVRACVDALQATGAQNVGGAMDPVGLTPMGRAIAAAGKSPFAVPTVFHVSAHPQDTDTVYLGAWPARVFKDVGLFDGSLKINEDYELNYRIRKAEGRVYFTPAIRSQYYGRQTLRDLFTQYFRYGRWKTRMLRLHPRSLRLRQLAAPLFVAALIGGLVVGVFVPVVRTLWLVMLGCYLALGVLFALQAARRAGHSIALVWRLLVVFFTIHTAWGLGFWTALAGK